MRIAISGKSGCGNTTVSTLVSKKLNFPLINFTFRQMAEERNIDFWTFCKMANEDYTIDRELDKRQVEMALSKENCVLGSRLAIWMLNSADLKVYLYASEKVRAERVLKREGGTYEERFEQTCTRDNNDTKRYLEIYNIDNRKYEEVADIIINTDIKDPESISDEIVKIVLKKMREAE